MASTKAQPKAPTYITAAEAAERLGITPAGFRGLMLQERKRGRDLRAPREQWRHDLFPVYDEAQLEAWNANRRGPGRWGPRTPDAS